MSGETYLSVIGNLTADPELRYTQTGLPVTNFTVASTPRFFDRAANDYKDGEALFIRCSLWRQPAENATGSLRKGDRVMVYGRLKQRNYQDREGVQRTAMELEVEEVGASLRYATAVLTKAAATTNASTPPRQADEPWSTPSAGQSDAWAPPGAYGDDTPF